MTTNLSIILDTFIRSLGSDLPSLSFSINEKEATVLIPPIYEEFGPIEIEENGDELIVYIGNFTHWHASCYDTTFTAARSAEAIAEEVVEFIKDIVHDRVFLWGSHRGGGGFAYKEAFLNEEELQARSVEARPLPGESSSSGERKWLWSGPLSD